MLATHNSQSSVAAGVLISDGYKFWAVEKDAKDITIKRSNIGDSRLILWIRSHPERDDRAHNPDKMDKGIFMADAVVTLKHETVKTLGSTRIFMVQVETLKLKKIRNEIIPMNVWHFRSEASLNLPILDDPADYQHRIQKCEQMIFHGTGLHCLGAQAEGKILLGSGQTSPDCVRLDGTWTESCEAGLQFPSATGTQSEMSAMRYDRLTTTPDTAI
jgi:hypothetical protein